MTEEEKARSFKGVSRREFIAGTVGSVVIGAAATAAAGSLGIPRTVQAASQIARQPSLDQGSIQASAGSGVPTSWDLSADVVIIGSGAAGLPAALAARALGASVLVVEANYDVGGHSIVSGGAVFLGGGTPGQTAAGIVDSPNLVFSDITDWTIVQPNGWPDYRYSDRGFCRALADNSVATYNLIVANGVKWTGPPAATTQGTGNSANRSQSAATVTVANLFGPNSGYGGPNFIRPLEASARKQGVQFLLNYHMDSIVRTGEGVVGVVAHYTGGRIPPGTGTALTSYADSQGMPGNLKMTQAEVNIWANKGVIIATGGHTGNTNFRRAFDPRLTEVYSGAGEPYSYQDASGELAGMAVGASFWGTTNQTLENGNKIAFRGYIGARYNYVAWDPNSPVFPFAGGEGLNVTNYQDLIFVNQVGQRIYNEMVAGNYPMGNGAGGVKPYTPDYYLNAQYITSSTAPGTPYDASDYGFLNAALAPNAFSQPPDYSAGPVWAIFDSAAVTREKWAGVTYPYVDTANGYFFSAPDLNTLAAAVIANPYQAGPMSGATLTATVTRYNSFVTSGVDSDFGKPKPAYQINTPPYYAAWATPQSHDCRSGLRINMKMQVMDWSGIVIPNLYCAGESAGGINQHGNGRCAVGGYIAGVNAAGGTTPP